MDIEQELRDILQRDAAELVPVGPGPEDARRRAFRRKRRVQSGVVIISAAGLVGGTLAVIETRDPAHGPGPRVQTQPVVATSDLAWRTVDGTVLVNGAEFTTPAGLTYALSTAPGAQPNPENGSAPQELYATRDGVTWTHESLGANPWVVDLAESKGVLYAVGTGPGAKTGSVGYKVSTSSDNGGHWSDSSLPVDFTAPESAVPLSESRSVHLARGAHTTVAMAKVSYYPDVSTVLGADVAFNETAAGVQILSKSDCLKTTTTTPPARGSAPEGCGMTVTSTRPWSDFGISDPAALHQQQALVRDDGGDWSKFDVPAAAGAWVQDVSATSNGFLMAEQLPGTDGVGNVQLWSSTDGRSWAQLAGVPKFDIVSIAGDRVIGVDSATATVTVSNDAGATWTAASDVAGLLPSGTAIAPYGTTISAGPLGYAVLVRSGEGQAPHNYLLHSSDGTSWKITDLGAAGAPANGQISSVSVGADHIDVSFQVPQVPPYGVAASYKLVELLGTPKAS